MEKSLAGIKSDFRKKQRTNNYQTFSFNQRHIERLSPDCFNPGNLSLIGFCDFWNSKPGTLGSFGWNRFSFTSDRHCFNNYSRPNFSLHHGAHHARRRPFVVVSYTGRNSRQCFKPNFSQQENRNPSVFNSFFSVGWHLTLGSSRYFNRAINYKLTLQSHFNIYRRI